MRSAEEIFNTYLGGNHNIASLKPVALYELINHARKELLQECIEIAHEQGILGYHEFIEPQLKKLLDQIK